MKPIFNPPPKKNPASISAEHAARLDDPDAFSSYVKLKRNPTEEINIRLIAGSFINNLIL